MILNKERNAVFAGRTVRYVGFRCSGVAQTALFGRNRGVAHAGGVWAIFGAEQGNRKPLFKEKAGRKVNVFIVK
jgi:hypothetical protein